MHSLILPARVSRTPRAGAFVAWLWIAASLAGGCAATGTSDGLSPAGDGPALTPQAASASGEQAPSLRASDVYRPAPWEKVYRDGPRIVRRVAVEGASPNEWTIEEYESADRSLRGALVRRTHLERGPDGSIFLSRLELESEGRILRFDPALVLMPEVLGPGEPTVSSADVVMTDARGEGKSRGEATQKVRLLTGNARRLGIETELIASFDFTTIDRTVRLEVDPARGIIGERQSRSVRVGLLNLSRKTSSVTLVEDEPQP